MGEEASTSRGSSRRSLAEAPCDSASVSSMRDDDSLLQAIANVPRVRSALAGVALPSALQGLLASELADASALPACGTIVDDRYRIESLLGSGGMGVVFAATHLQTDKPVALKWMYEGTTVRNDAEREEARRRFEREARIATRVRHPNLVDVTDADSNGQRSYLVMERLVGETLGARMRRGALSWDELMKVLLPTLRGVAALHAEGVLHRDLKPDNIYLAQVAGSREPCPKVLDFGVATLHTVARTPEESPLTRPGAVLGTPAYMPLEQLLGEPNLDARADVYALGVIAYEALSRRRPVLAGNAAEHAAVLASQPTHHLGALLPELRGDRAGAVMRALARDASQRFPDVEAFCAALLQARPPRPQRLTALAAALCLGVAIALYVILGASHLRGGADTSVRAAAPLPADVRSAPTARVDSVAVQPAAPPSRQVASRAAPASAPRVAAQSSRSARVTAPRRAGASGRVVSAAANEPTPHVGPQPASASRASSVTDLSRDQFEPEPAVIGDLAPPGAASPISLSHDDF